MSSSPTASSEPAADSGHQDGEAGLSGSSAQSPRQNKKPALKAYIETFGQDTMRETATLMSREGASLLDRQTKALWGDVHELQAEMQKALRLAAAETPPL